MNKNLSAGTLVPQLEKKMGGRIIQGGRRRLIFSCQSFFQARALVTCRCEPRHWISKVSSGMKKYVIVFRLHRVVSRGVLSFPMCTILCERMYLCWNNQSDSCREQKFMCSLTLYGVWETTTPFQIRHGRHNFLKCETRQRSCRSIISRADHCNSMTQKSQPAHRLKSREKFRHSWELRNRLISEVESYSCRCSTTLNTGNQVMSKHVSKTQERLLNMQNQIQLGHWCFCEFALP